MRSILFFDLPMVTATELRNYRNFLKELKRIGFYMIQESVYVKMSIDKQSADSIVKKINSFLPPKGSILVLTITEKQFSQIEVLLGENKTDVITTDDRIIIL